MRTSDYFVVFIIYLPLWLSLCICTAIFYVITEIVLIIFCCIFYIFALIFNVLNNDMH